MIKVVVDSTADIPDDLAQQVDIRIVPLNVHFGDETLRDGIDITKDEFYQRLVESNVTPKTSAPTIGSFVETYEQLAKETDTILSLHLGGKLSATVTAARQAAPEVSHVHIEIVDTNSIATPITYMAVAAVKAMREGKKLDEIVALVHNIEIGRASCRERV